MSATRAPQSGDTTFEMRSSRLCQAELRVLPKSPVMGRILAACVAIARRRSGARADRPGDHGRRSGVTAQAWRPDPGDQLHPIMPSDQAADQVGTLAPQRPDRDQVGTLAPGSRSSIAQWMPCRSSAAR